MKRDSRHINDSWSSRIYDYLFGNMPKRERNTLEREEQSDIFLSDALSGLDGVVEDEYLTDMKDLQKRLSVHRNNSGRVKWIAIAATLLFVVGISSLLFLLVPQDANKLAQNKTEPAPKVESINEDSNNEIQNTIVAEREVIPEKGVAVKAEPIPREEVAGSSDMKSVEKPLVLHLVDDDIELDEELEVSDSETVEVVKRKKVMQKSVARSVVKVSVEDAGEDYVSAPVNVEDRKAEPEMGIEEYKETIKSQIRKLLNGKKIKVTVELTVSVKGSINSVEILKTSDKSYNKEIKRIFKEGPAWQPAYSNGIAVEENVKIKLTIKKGKRPLSSLQT